MKPIGIPANPELTAYRAEIDAFIAALNGIQRPFEQAVATLRRIRDSPVPSELLSEMITRLRPASAVLREYANGSGADTPAALARALRDLERNLRGTQEDGK